MSTELPGLVTPGLVDIDPLGVEPLPAVPLEPMPAVLGLVLILLPLPVALGMLGVPAGRSRTSFLAASQHLKLLSALEPPDCATAGAEANASSAAPANSEIIFIGVPFIPFGFGAAIR